MLNISINKSPLFNVLSKTQTIAGKRSSMPILSNVLLETDETSLIIKATNLEVGIKLICDAEVHGQGKIALNAKALFDIIREMPDDKINIVIKENDNVEITCGNAVFHISGIDSQEFPKMMDYEGSQFSVIAFESFKNMIEKSMFSISNDETRPFLNGAYLETIKKADKTFLRMVTTDGRRLSLVDKESVFPESLSLDKGIILPQKGLYEILKSFDSGSGSCEIAFEKNFLILKESSTILYMRIVDGSYPEYSRAIPEDLNTKVYIDRNLLLSTLKRVSLLSDERTKSIRFLIENNEMKVYTDTSNLGDATDNVPVESTSEESIDIGFNSKFVLDVLNVIDTDKIIFDVKDSNSAGVFYPSDSKDYLYVIMPLRI
jgi:DNA polymerase-3 subunit beta